MKIPQIKGENKIRDTAIMRCFLEENLPYQEIGLKFNLTGSRIQQIVYENRGLISWDKNYEKAQRINALKRLEKKYSGYLGNKTTIDILEQLRKEIDGDKPLVDNSQHAHFTYVWQNQTNSNPLQPSRLPDSDT